MSYKLQQINSCCVCYVDKGGLDTQGVSEVQFCTTELPQLFEFEVATCTTCRLSSKRPFWKPRRLICKNDEALRKTGVLACQFVTPY